MEVPLNDQQRPMMHGPDPFKKSLPKVPGPVTPEVVRYLAREEARKEIVATSTALANKVQEVMARSMAPLNEKFSIMYSEQYKTAVSVNALVEMLIEKGLFTKEEIEAKVTKMHEQEIEKQQEISERKAVIASGKAKVLPDPETPTEE
jgi:hypothetical protein